MIFNGNIIEEFFLQRQITYRKNYPLSKASTFRIGGNAAFAAYPHTVSELSALLNFCKSKLIYHAVIGNASNVLFSDEGFDGIVIFTSELTRINVEGNTVHAECGVPLTFLSGIAQKNGLGGFEFAYGIPGTLGGAVYMNAGAYGGEMNDIIESVSWYDKNTGNKGVFSNSECSFDYRDSIFQHTDLIILSAVLRLKKRECELIKADMIEYMSRRREKQPLEFPNAGSTFKRYPGYFTGKLIEEAGLKGYSVGGAQVSEKHAGFIINRENATAADVLNLIEFIKHKIFEMNGINIECEVKFIPYSKG